MATTSSFGNMLNAYGVLQEEKKQSKDLTSERERIRNQMIDQGVKPSEEEIDLALLQSKVV